MKQDLTDEKPAQNQTAPPGKAEPYKDLTTQTERGEISPVNIHEATDGAENPWAKPLVVEHPRKRSHQAGSLRAVVAQEATRIIFGRVAALGPQEFEVLDLFVLYAVVSLTLTRSKWEDRIYVATVENLAGVANSTARKYLSRLRDKQLIIWQPRQGRNLATGHGYMSTVGITESVREEAKAAYLRGVNAGLGPSVVTQVEPQQR